MNTGIYRLYWPNVPNSTYIGQSIDINSRLKNHIQKLRSNIHPNYKIASLYESYGPPELEILEQCNQIELYEKEVYWVVKFNSIRDGLNIAEPGYVGYGENHGSSIYTKVQYLMIFRSLYLSNTLTCKQIADKLNVSEYIVSSISQGTSHMWLNACYPLQYSWMLKKVRSSLRLRNITNIVISPSGEEFSVTNIREFARNNNLNNGHLSRLLSGKIVQHKGWTLKN